MVNNFQQSFSSASSGHLGDSTSLLGGSCGQRGGFTIPAGSSSGPLGSYSCH